MRKNSEQHTSSVFKKFLIIYVIVLAVIMVCFLVYVVNSLTKYNKMTNYMDYVVEDLSRASKKNKMEKHMDISKMRVNEFEEGKVSVDEGLKEVFNSQDITYKVSKTTNDSATYNVYANGKEFLKVELDGSKKETRLGLLTFNLWETKQIEPIVETGLHSYNIQVPNSYSVYVNDKVLTEDYIVEKVQNEGLTQISKYVEIPYVVKYEVSGLWKEANIKVFDEQGNEIACERDGNTIKKGLDFISAENEEIAKENIKGKIDIMQVAKDWSLYLTADLKGKLHGYHNIKKYFIADSDIEKFAYKWATGVDITFVSDHTLLNPAFTEEKISNFEIYNENAFSCEVYLQKHLKLVTSRKTILDEMHERMYFAYHDGEWKLVNMQSVVDNEK